MHRKLGVCSPAHRLRHSSREPGAAFGVLELRSYRSLVAGRNVVICCVGDSGSVDLSPRPGKRPFVSNGLRLATGRAITHQESAKDVRQQPGARQHK